MDFSQIGQGPKVDLIPAFESAKTMCAAISEKHHDFFKDAEADAQYRPLMYAVCENGEIVPIMVQFDGDESKDLFCEHMTVAFKHWRVARYSFAMEAWLATGVTDENKHLAPSQRTDRKEVIFTSVIDKNGDTAMSAFDMVRDWKTNKVIELRDISAQFEGTDFGGRFANLFGNKPMPDYF